MYIDALLRVAVAQAFGAGAVSASSIDLGVPGGVGTPPSRQIGTGEPVGFAVQFNADATVAAPLIEVISATDALLTAGVLVHSSISVPLASAKNNTVWFAPLPPGTPTQRYLGVRVTTAGGTATATAWLTALSLFSLLPVSYGKAYVV
jgi:hypothetical protein